MDLKIVCPTKSWGVPVVVIKSATTTSLLINWAEDGLTKWFSKSSIVDSTPNNTLNKIVIDSSIPFDW